MCGCDVAADGAAPSSVASVRGRQWHHQDLAGNLGDHQPVGGWQGGIDGRFVVEVIEVKSLHSMIVLQPITDGYGTVSFERSPNGNSHEAVAPTLAKLSASP